MIKCLTEKGPRTVESILKYYMLYPERFIGVDRKITTPPCESKQSPTEISDQQTAAMLAEEPEQQMEVPEEQMSVIITELSDEQTSVVPMDIPEEQILVEVMETPEQQTSETRTDEPEHQISDTENYKNSSGDGPNSEVAKETTEYEENESTQMIENSSSSTYSDSSSSNTSTLIAGFSSGISVRLKDFSSGPTTPRAGTRKSRRNAARKLKRRRPTTSPINRQKGQLQENSKRFQYICKAYAPQRCSNLYNDFKALQKKIVNERTVGDVNVNCRSHNTNVCEGSSPPKRRISRIRAADPLKNLSKNLWTSRSTPGREKFLSGQPYALLSKKMAQQTVSRMSKSRGRTKNRGSSKGKTVLKNKNIAEVYSFTPSPQMVARLKH